MRLMRPLAPLKRAYRAAAQQWRLNRLLADRGPDDSPHRLFNGCDDDYWYWLNTEGWRRSPALRELLPGLPTEDQQNRFTGGAGDHTLREGFNVYRLVKSIAQDGGRPIRPTSQILDYGCGWGRIIRFFLKDVEPANLWGIDCCSEVLDICKATNRWCDFRLVTPLPPTELPAEAFDLVYAYSVFSHLSEDAHLRWLDEFQRVLKPGGLLMATTWPRDLIQRCADIRARKDYPFWERGLAHSFLDTPKALADYDAGAFCHSPVGGGDVLDASFFGETCISKAYVRERWTPRFQFVDYLADPQRCLQNVIVVRK